MSHRTLCILLAVAIVAAVTFVSGCGGNPKNGPGNNGDDGPAAPLRITPVRFVDPIHPVAQDGAILVRGARNETVHFALQVNDPPRELDKKTGPGAIILSNLNLPSGEASIAAGAIAAYQVLPMPVNANRAGFVRHTGLPVSDHRLPRALLPLPNNNGQIPYPSLRNPSAPLDPASSPDDAPSAKPLLWFDVQIPPTAAPGDYEGKVELHEAGKPVTAIPIQIHVEDFVIPDDRGLSIVGKLEWDALLRVYPTQFKGAVPHLLSRNDPDSAAAIRVLDDLVKLAQSHRTQVIVPRLQPAIKWPAGKPPAVDWTDFDSIVAPWMNGDAFPDRLGLGYWPLPPVDKLDLHPAGDRNAYWAAAANHFGQLDWINRSAVVLPRPQPGGPIGQMEALDLSIAAAQILAVHPSIRVAVPLLEEQVRLADVQNPRVIQKETLDRLCYTAAGLVSVIQINQLPPDTATAWLRTDVPHLVPQVGAGADERHARLFAWLAFVRDARLVLFDDALPGQPDPAAPAEADELIWFYPGEWFGLDYPIPSIQLKWLRRAQQDFEYLRLAKSRGQGERALELAKLMVKPVERQPFQRPDAAQGLLSGTADPKAWDDAEALLARIIQLSKPGQPTDAAADRELQYALNTWHRAQSRPILLPRSTLWTTANKGNAAGPLHLQLGIDIYNTADLQPERNRLEWARTPPNWAPSANAVDVPKMGRYQVDRFTLESHVNIDKLDPTAREPIKVRFIEGYTQRPFEIEMVVPAGYSERRQGAPPRLDGDLSDWMAEDALFRGPLVHMFDRPTVQQQRVRFAAQTTAIYTTWTPANLFVAFRVEGADAPLTNTATNFVARDPRFNRAWSEDVVEFLMQPVYADGSLGPLVQLAFKPAGQIEVSRRLDPRAGDHWQGFVTPDIQYGSNINKGIWQGECNLAWDALYEPNAPRQPVKLLRFNFTQYRGRVGHSATWAGPVDSGRDEHFMGAIEIRHPERPGFTPRNR